MTMNDFIQERKSLVTLFMVILFLLLGLVYFYLVKPLKDESNAAKANVNQLETDVQILEAEIAKSQNEKSQFEENQFFHERKMPLDRSIDELILSLQEIEMVSESRIEDITFNNYDSSLTEADQVIENEVEETDESAETDEEGTAEDIDTTEPPISDVVEELPDNIKLITVNLSVVSPNFKQFEAFLQEVEKLERITRVDTLSFSKPGEAELLDSETDEDDAMITTNVQITTFYYDENESIIDE